MLGINFIEYTLELGTYLGYDRLNIMFAPGYVKYNFVLQNSNYYS